MNGTLTISMITSILWQKRLWEYGKLTDLGIVMDFLNLLVNIIGKDLRALPLTRLQRHSKIKRIGSDKTGHWEITYE